jgi:hypothetical protein
VSAKSDGGNGHSRLESDGADLRRYLLGQMSEAEEGGVERACLGSDDALEALRAREDELIEEYLADALEPAERERFERLFLASPPRLERLVFLRALQDRAAPRALRLVPSPGARSWPRAAAVVVVVVVAGLLGVRAWGTRPSPVDGAAPPAARRAVSESFAGAPPAVPTPPPQVVSLRLRQPALRGGGEVPVVDPGAAGLAVLEAPLDARDGFAAHRGRVAAPDGREVFVSPWQPNRGETTLRVVVPSAVLRDGRHVLVVEARAAIGEEPVESYAFLVRRR